MSSESLGQAVANNTNWINSVISNSKLASQLTELLSIDSLDQKINIQEGELDAQFVNAKTLRGYKGDWEADTNNPVLSNSSGVVGDIYKVSIGGNINIGSGSIDYVAGDLVYLSEDNWIKISPNQISDITGLNPILDNTVRLTGNQTIAGQKTFTDLAFFNSSVTAPTFLGDLNGTINTLTTAITKPNATSDATVATTAFVKNLIGEIPSGLAYEGNWNADTNIPNLQTTNANSGQFWIVSNPGSTYLSGITDWKSGDWAIYISDGAGNDRWQKVDNSSVLNGQGTGQVIPKWGGLGDSKGLVNSPMRVIGSAVVFSGNIAIGTPDTYTLRDKFTLFNPSTNVSADCQMNFSTGYLGTSEIRGMRVGWNGEVGQISLYENADLRFSANDLEVLRLKADTTAIFRSKVTAPNGIFTQRVGIGITLPEASLHIKDGTNINLKFGGAGSRAQIKSTNDADTAYAPLLFRASIFSFLNGDLGIGTLNPGATLDVRGTGLFSSTVTATNFILSSDERLKTNIKEIDNEYINVNWKNFELKSDKGQKRYGVIAQELEKTNPEFVRTDKEGMKSVAYIDLLIAKIAELDARLEKAGI